MGRPERSTRARGVWVAVLGMAAGCGGPAFVRRTEVLEREWARRFGDAGDDWVSAVSTDAAGNIVVSGGFAGAIDFGGGALKSEDEWNVFVAKLDLSGRHTWSRRFGNLSFGGTLDVGRRRLTSVGGQDVFLVKLAP